MSQTMIWAPSSASRIACDRPCPRAPPVIRATLPSNFPIGSGSRLDVRSQEVESVDSTLSVEVKQVAMWLSTHSGETFAGTPALAWRTCAVAAWHRARDPGDEQVLVADVGLPCQWPAAADTKR